MRSSRRRGALRTPPRWLWLVQLLCVLAGLHLSGVAHGIAELVGGPDVDCGELCATPCELESSGVGCPPGCPSCSCAHGRTPSLPPPLEPSLTSGAANERMLSALRYTDDAPPSPELSPPDRPPRA